MKKLMIPGLIAAALLLCACTPVPEIEVVMPSAAADVAAAEAADTGASDSPEQSAQVSAGLPSPTPVPLPTPVPPPPTPTPYSGPALYTSNAHMVSFDPATGLASFDYFEKLTGQDAIDWMVDHQGYSVSEATDIVNDFADSEYVYKNTNPQLRVLDLGDYPLKLMYLPDGTVSLDATNFPSSAADAAALYAVDPDLLLNTFDYVIHVNSSGHVTLIEQIYWP